MIQNPGTAPTVARTTATGINWLARLHAVRMLWSELPVQNVTSHMISQMMAMRKMRLTTLRHGGTGPGLTGNSLSPMRDSADGVSFGGSSEFAAAAGCLV